MDKALTNEKKFALVGRINRHAAEGATSKLYLNNDTDLSRFKMTVANAAAMITHCQCTSTIISSFSITFSLVLHFKSTADGSWKTKTLQASEKCLLFHLDHASSQNAQPHHSQCHPWSLPPLLLKDGVAGDELFSCFQVSY
jgi:hypothetical protein